MGRIRKLLNLSLLFFAPLSSVVIMMLGNGFFITFISVYLEQSGFRKSEIGFVQSAYFFGMFLGAFKMEGVIRRIGHVQSLALFGSMGTCSILLQGIFPYIWVWIPLRFLVGLCIAAIFIVIESWMLDRSTPKNRGMVLSLYMTGIYIAQALSQQFLKVVSIDSLLPFILCGLFTSMCIIPVALSVMRMEMPSASESVKFRRIIQKSPFGVAGCFVCGMVASTIYSFFPLYAIAKGMPSDNFMLVTIAGGVIMQWPIGKLSDLFERRKTLVAVVLMTLALSLLALSLHDGSSSLLLALAFFIGGFAFTLYPLGISQVCDHFEHIHITGVTAFLLLVYGCGSVIGPIVSSYTIDLFGIDSIFALFSLLLAGLGILGIFAVATRSIIPLEEQNAYVALPRSTPVAYEMDPRAEGEQ